MRGVLHFQSDRIEQVLASHKVPSRVTGGTVTPRLVRFQLATPFGVKVSRVANLSEEIALGLGTRSCRVYREEGQMQIEVPREQGQVVHLPELIDQLRMQESRGGTAVPPVTAVLGVDQDGAPLLLRLPSPDVAHVLVAGTTGSGKTALARSIIASLVLLNGQRSLQLVLVDPKGRGFVPFEGLPHLLEPVVTRAEEAIPLLERLIGEMERRDREGRSEPRLVIVLDELADLIQVGGREMEARLMRLTQRGREAGLHLIACTQKPTSSLIGSIVKSNFPVRLVGSVASPEDAKVASGLAKTGAERLLGRGDFLIVVKGQVTRLQAAYISTDDVKALADKMQAPPCLLLPGGSTRDDSAGARRRLSVPAANLREALRRKP